MQLAVALQPTRGVHLVLSHLYSLSVGRIEACETRMDRDMFIASSRSVQSMFQEPAFQGLSLSVE